MTVVTMILRVVAVYVRTAQEYSEKHIPGAINIANESIGTEDISELPDKD